MRPAGPLGEPAVRRGREATPHLGVHDLGYSRAGYAAQVLGAFMQCTSMQYLGGVPHRCLYDNAKVVTLGRDAHLERKCWTALPRPHTVPRPRAKSARGQVRAAQHVAQHPDADLNRQALEWCDTVAETPGCMARVPWEMLVDGLTAADRGSRHTPTTMCQRFRQAPLRLALEVGGRHLQVGQRLGRTDRQ